MYLFFGIPSCSLDETKWNQDYVYGENALQQDNSAARFIEQLINQACMQGASDIHFEPYDGFHRIRIRQDGILYETEKPSAILAKRIAIRLKVMSKLDITERRMPQDGRFTMQLATSKNIDVRFSSCPTIHGEKIVLRLLDASNVQLQMDTLGLTQEQQQQFSQALNQSQGLILVTGPTGCGKTVTLYSALNHLNKSTKNISTVEDPIEIKLNGINQVNVDAKNNLTFAKVLRAFLRQDPDIIVLGEMRDLDSAAIAIRAAQTGHLVLSTLHTNSAVDTLTRLKNMGILPYNIASSISLVIAQRLVRKLCQHCKQLPEKIKACHYCRQGYHGRIGLFELLPITPAIAELIITGATVTDINKIAREMNLLNLRQAGLEKVQQGITHLAEVDAITQ